LRRAGSQAARSAARDDFIQSNPHDRGIPYRAAPRIEANAQRAEDDRPWPDERGRCVGSSQLRAIAATEAFASSNPHDLDARRATRAAIRSGRSARCDSDVIRDDRVR
jgi:hypothetical protein